jgi:predicted MFS family arabinose efflux permease
LSGFTELLRGNRNYRFTWTGQVVSEVGDHYNNVAVFALALANTGSGLVVAGILISRAICAVIAGPIAGVLLDRMDRKRIMIISDLVRASIAIAFIFGIPQGRTSLLYVLSGALMFASPFFSSGRASILPTIATRHELHSANSLTQLTQWTTLTLGSFLGGTSVSQFGYKLAFLFNAFSFLFSAWCISRLHVESGFRAQRSDMVVLRPWREYTEGLRYMKSSPLILGIGLVAVGWATGGGAAQILFSVFGEVVFHRGATGIGIIWGSAGIGLIIGALVAHRIGRTISFENYKRLISISYVIHGGSYVLFSQAKTFGWALFFIGLSRAAVAVSSVLNVTQQLRHVSDEFRGRVFATIESWNWMTMMLSMAVAGLASTHVSPRIIGAWAGVFSSSTAVFWAWANWTGRLPEPELSDVDPDDVDVRDDPTV